MIESMKWVSLACRKDDLREGVWRNPSWFPLSSLSAEAAGKGLPGDPAVGCVVASDCSRMHIVAVYAPQAEAWGLPAVPSALQIVKAGKEWRPLPVVGDTLPDTWWKAVSFLMDVEPMPDALALDDRGDMLPSVIPLFMFTVNRCFNYDYIHALAGERWDVALGGPGRAALFTARGGNLMAVIMPLRMEAKEGGV